MSLLCTLIYLLWDLWYRSILILFSPAVLFFSWISSSIYGCCLSGHCRKHMKTILNVSTGRSIIKTRNTPAWRLSAVPPDWTLGSSRSKAAHWLHWGKFESGLSQGSCWLTFSFLHWHWEHCSVSGDELIHSCNVCASRHYHDDKKEKQSKF